MSKLAAVDLSISKQFAYTKMASDLAKMSKEQAAEMALAIYQYHLRYAQAVEDNMKEVWEEALTPYLKPSLDDA